MAVKQDPKLLDQIKEYLFTMNNDELTQVRDFIEDMLSNENGDEVDN